MEIIAVLIVVCLLISWINWEVVFSVLGWIVVIFIAIAIISAIAGKVKEADETRKKNEVALAEKRRIEKATDDKAKEDIENSINKFAKNNNYIEAMLFVKSERERKSFAINQLSKYKEDIYAKILARIVQGQYQIAKDLLTDLCNLFPKEKKFLEQKFSVEKILQMRNSNTPIIIGSDGKLNKNLIDEFGKITMTDYINSLGDYSLSHGLWYYALNKEFDKSLYSSNFDAAKDLGTDKFALPIDAFLSLIYISRRYGDKVAQSIYPHIDKLEQRYRQNADKEMLENLETIILLAKGKI